MLRSECYSASFWKLARDLNSFAPRRLESTSLQTAAGVEVGLSESSRQLALSACGVCRSTDYMIQYMPLFYAPFSGGVPLFGLAGAHFSSRYRVIYCLAVGNGWPKRFLNSKDGERRVINKLPTSRHESSLSKLSEKEHWISGNVLEDRMSNPVYIGDPTDTDCRLNWLLIHQEMS